MADSVPLERYLSLINRILLIIMPANEISYTG
ncbi:hypothetical protein PMI13_03361 [Chryseobacterium populi]|uniref:Uncharacterized protein n=1 Tax=Chryseobacterium populi TaxID=1144316 RepID=J3CDC1_9FLAO|nr:hypothetical protein PMI13_03361 [Chryseobacterium populi]